MERCENCGLALIETQSGVAVKGPYKVGDVAAERYEIHERVGVEPLYWTYAAYDLEHELPVMVRAVRRTILPRSLDSQSFARRLAPLTSLDLPGVTGLRRVDRDEGITLVISELVDGLPLRSLMDLRRDDNRAFSALETIAVLALVAEALEAAAPVTHHGDLRPTHLLIREDELRVEAMGVAAALPWEETVRALKDAPATSAYLAPEVLEGQFSDSRSDIYSLAMIACELLTGRPPPIDTALLDDYLNGLPPMTDDILRRALSPDAARRDAAPSELVEALAVVLGVEPLRPRRGTDALDGPRAAPPDATVEVVRDDDGDTRPAARVKVEGFSRDPAVPAFPSPEGTQQITEDMIEPLDEDDDAETAPREIEPDPAIVGALAADEPSGSGEEDQLEDWPEVPDVESIRSLGLDPRLVRAARKLDDERSDDSPTIRREAMTEDQAEALIEAVPFPSAPHPKVSYKPAPPPRRTRPGAGEPATEEAGDHPTDRYSPPSPRDLKLVEAEPAPASAEPELSEGGAELVSDEPALAAVGADLVFDEPALTERDVAPLSEEPELTERSEPRLAQVYDLTERRPPAEAAERTIRQERLDLPANSPWSDGETTSPSETEVEGWGPDSPEQEVPAALRGSSLGPLQERVAGGEVHPPRLDEPSESQEPEPLPPVLIDEALSEAFGPSRPADEPTYRVERPAELTAYSTVRSKRPKMAERSVWRVIIPVALVGGALLAALSALGLWIVLSR